MFLEKEEIKVGNRCLEVAVDDTTVVIETNGGFWVCLWWKDWDQVKKTIEEIRKRHEKEIRYINI